MKELYLEIQRINKIDPASPDERMCKLLEEFGELAQGVNKTLGRKVITESEEEIIENIQEEVADTIQCALSYLDSIGFDLQYLNDNLFNHFEWLKNEQGISDLSENIAKTLIDLSVEITKMYTNNKKTDGYFVINNALIIGATFGMTFTDVINKIHEKNIKWERVAKKRIENL